MMEEIKPDDFFASIGIDEKELQEADKRQKKRGKVDRRVCICGHGVSKHRYDAIAGQWSCKPAFNCPCKSPVAVMEVTNIKSFLRKTEGGGTLHALFGGLQGMKELDKEATFKQLIPWICHFCQSDKNIKPEPLTKDGRRTRDGLSMGYDAFVCDECRMKI